MKKIILFLVCFLTITLANANMISLMISNTTQANQILTVTSNDTLFIGNWLSSLYINTTYMSGPGTTLIYPCNGDTTITISDGSIIYYDITNSSLATGVTAYSTSNSKMNFIYNPQEKTIKPTKSSLMNDVYVYDCLGNLIICEKEINIMTINVKAGLYIISALIDRKVYTQKIVIE